MHPLVRFRRSVRTAAAAIAAVALSAAAIQAQPISFFFRGNATGSLAGTPFQGTAFSIQLDANIANITTPFGPTVPRITGLTGQATLAGFGSFTINTPLFVFVNQTDRVAGFGGNPSGALIVDILDLGPIPGLATFGLNTSFAQTSGAQFALNFTNVPTTSGALTFTSTSGTSFQAITASAVPEPATYALVASGLLVIGGLARRRARG